MLILFIAALIAQAGDPSISAEGWARKAKPIATCSGEVECASKWQKATAWVRANSRFQVAVDKPDLFATYGAVYANTDLSFVVAISPKSDGSRTISARAWCGNVFTCKPKPKDAVAAITRALAE